MGILSFFKSLSPHSLTEILLFVICCIIVIIFIHLFNYTIIQQKVKKHSRCYKNAILSSTRTNEYSVIGYTLKENIEILKITYDFKNKTSTIKITAPPGSVINKIEFQLYNLKTFDVDTVEKTFNSTMNFNLLEEEMLYIGHPELVRFMQYGNTDFFEKILFS
jgi:hypothetical protein